MIEKLYQSAVKLLVPLTLEETYNTIIQEAMSLVGAKYGSIFLMEKGALKRVSASDPELFKVIPRRRGRMFTIYKQHKAKVLTAKEIEKLHPEFSRLNAGSDITIPLRYHNIILGVLSVLSHKNTVFSQENLTVMKAFEPLATLALRNTLLYADLEQALAARDLFISIAAHELRTPMTSIYGYTQLIERDVLRGKSVQPRQLEKLIASEERMIKLLNELLQIEQVRRGKLQFTMERCNIKNITKLAVQDFKYQFPNHKTRFISMLSKKQEEIIGDKDKLHQTITNILNNAGKYTPENSLVEITLLYKEDHVVVEITDHGKGISKKDLQLIFERYYKGDGAKKQGMGLGLYLVKHIVEKHNGLVQAHSKVGKGTTISILLPTDEEENGT